MQASTPQGLQNTKVGSFVSKEQRSQMNEAQSAAQVKQEELSKKGTVQESSDILKDKLDGVSEEQKKAEQDAARERALYTAGVKEDYGFEVSDSDLESLVFTGSIEKEARIVRGIMSVLFKSSTSSMIAAIQGEIAKYRHDNPIATQDMISNEGSLIWLSHQIVSIKNEKTGKVVNCTDPSTTMKHLRGLASGVVERLDSARRAFEYCVRIKMGDVNELKK